MPRLRARQPDKGKNKRHKLLLFGPSGTGKSKSACCFPAAYYIDTEGGADLPEYQEQIETSRSVYMGKEEGSQDFATLINEVRALATTKHDYQWLIIDSFTKIYLLEAAQAEREVGSEYGADKKAANKPTRQLMFWLERLDMNVLIICHAKEKWGRQGKNLFSEGKTFDGYDKLEYDLDLAIELRRDKGQKMSHAVVVKSRLKELPLEATFPWNYDEFSKRAGVILAPAKPFEPATDDQVAAIQHLVGQGLVSEAWVEGCLKKAGASSWEEMATDKAEACLKHLRAIGQKQPEEAAI